MLTLTRRPLFAAGWGLAAYVAVLGWQQSLTRDIVAQVHVETWVPGFPVSAGGFAALHSELLETARFRAEQRGNALRIADQNDRRVVECDDLPGAWPGSLADGREGCRVVGVQGGAL